MKRVDVESRLMKVFLAGGSAGLIERLDSMLAEIPGAVVVGRALAAPEALSEIRRLKPDVAVLDIRMPGGGGVTVLEKIKRRLPAIVVMMLTSYPYPQYRRRCMESGADFFLDKSQDSRNLKEILTTLARDFTTTEAHE